MGAIPLRADRCLNCGATMPTGARIDRRYCKPSCRTLAYRIRKRTGAPSTRRARVPQWAEGQPPVISSALAALADLQARVLHLAHHLEQDDIAFRHPCPSNAAPAPPTEQRPAPSPPNPELARRIQELEAALQQAQAEASAAKQRAEAAQERQYDLDDQRRVLGDLSREKQTRIGELLTKLDQAEEREAAWHEKERAWRAEPPKQRGDQTHALEAARRTEAALRQELAGVQGENKALQASAKHAAKLEAQLREAANRQGEWQATETSLREQLDDATTKIDELETALTESQQIAKAVSQLRQANAIQKRELAEAQEANEALQAKVQKLTPPPAATDPLNLLMKEKVRLLHSLGKTQLKADRLGMGNLFPWKPSLGDFTLTKSDEPSIFAAGLAMAAETRREFCHRSRYASDPKPTWIHQDRQLDSGSEKTLYEKLEKEVAELHGHLRQAKLRLGEWT